MEIVKERILVCFSNIKKKVFEIFSLLWKAGYSKAILNKESIN